MYDQPTVPEPQQVPLGAGEDVDEEMGPLWPPATGSPTAKRGGSPSAANLSRRMFMGKSLAAIAAIGSAGVASAAGGIALEQWLQHGGWNSLFHGPMASSSQTGHLLRRAGFGATSSELQMYSGLGFNEAVDRLLNYSQVPDDGLENRL